MGINVGSAFVTLYPSMKGFGSKVNASFASEGKMRCCL